MFVVKQKNKTPYVGEIIVSVIKTLTSYQLH